MPLVPISEPVEGSAGETRTWREERPKIDHEKCTGCLICWMFCPEASVKRREDEVEVDLRYCKGCGICAEECPIGCIEMVKEGSE